MRATLLLVVAHAAALAALCAAGGPERAEAEECECCAATVTDLESHVAELRAENLALRKVNERQASDLDECRAESVKQPLVWRLAAEPRPRPRAEQPPAPPQGSPCAAAATRSCVPPEDPCHSRSDAAHCDPDAVHSDPDDRHPIGDAERLARANDHSYHDVLAARQRRRRHCQLGDCRRGAVRVPLAGTHHGRSGPHRVDRGKLGGRRRSRDAGRRGPLAPFLVKDGGSLSLSFLDLVNATAPGDISSDCIGNYDDCWGATILVTSGGTLTVSSCLIRGGGPGESEAYGAAFAGAGVAVAGPGVNVEFYDVNFQHLRGSYGAAFGAWYCSEDLPCQAIFRSCRFEKNVGLTQALFSSDLPTFRHTFTTRPSLGTME